MPAGQKRLLMRLEFFQPRDFVVIQSVFGFVLVLAIIIGATGPATYYNATFTTYNCQDGDHYNGPCAGGVDIGKNFGPSNNVNFSNVMVSKPMSSRNEFMGISFMPYAQPGDSAWFYASAKIVTDVKVNYGTLENPIWDNYFDDLVSEVDFTCYRSEGNGGTCSELIIAQVTRITFEWYQIVLYLDAPAGCTSSECYTSWMADSQVAVYSLDANYTNFVLGFRTTFALLAIIVFVAYAFALRNTWVQSCFSNNPTPEQSAYEQKWGFLLLGALILYCDPFYGLRLVSYSFLLEIVSVFFEVISDSSLLLFWLITLDKIQKDDHSLDFTWFYLPKLIAVGIYALFDMISLSWLRSHYAFNPVLTNDSTFNSSIFPLIVVTQVIFFLIIVWTVYLVVSSWVEITNRRQLGLRFALLGFPTVLLVMSEVVGMFGGVLNNSKPSSLAFAYFFFLRNAYVYAIIAGFWPSAQVAPTGAQHAVEVVDDSQAAEGERSRLITLSHGVNPFGAIAD